MKKIIALSSAILMVIGLSLMNLGSNIAYSENIAADPSDLPAPLTRTEPQTVEIELEAKEVRSEIAEGATYSYWTFDGQVPGPFLRVRQGDTIKLTLTNNEANENHHSIDLHAVTGPGGGAEATTVKPGESKTVTFKALNPGLFVYHCAHPSAAVHMSHGMYGLILVEPEGGLPPVDHEFYVMQGEFYSNEKNLNEPKYIVFNGKGESLDGKMIVSVNDTVRIYMGNGGVNFISSFHIVGEIFDQVYPEASIGNETHKNIQTTLVPAGGATIVEFTAEMPGDYFLVDHALARISKGAIGTLTVLGEENHAIFEGEEAHGHNH
ncbi:multicopper oxidase domain-containing protein [Candidatus Peregrinibacteria bacterium]|nr:MAG: multicopper oxidase domain-containing protein [Candidatus Peregrinibacteria bacterium]